MQLGTSNEPPEHQTVPAIEWVQVCEVADVLPATGVAALLHGEQIAIVRTRESEFHAVSNFDPFSKAYVISRGIVGDRNGASKIASPIFKQNFDLRTGACMDDPTVQLQVYPVRVVNGRVLVGVQGRPR
jgi:nitrite reductase (NADH) small subunit